MLHVIAAFGFGTTFGGLWVAALWWRWVRIETERRFGEHERRLKAQYTVRRSGYDYCEPPF